MFSIKLINANFSDDEKNVLQAFAEDFKEILQHVWSAVNLTKIIFRYQ